MAPVTDKVETQVEQVGLELTEFDKMYACFFLKNY